MDSYYANQATSLPHFSGHYRQRGSGFGALSAAIGRVALPLARRFILPTAKRIGKELLKQSVPELLDVVSSKKSPKQALKNTISNTVKKQTGGARFRQQRKTIRSRSKKSPRKTLTKQKLVISKQKVPKRSRSVTNEETHSSLDLFEKPALLVTFDGSFCQKLGPDYSPDGHMLEFEVTGDRNNFIDLQKIFFEVKCTIVQSSELISNMTGQLLLTLLKPMLHTFAIMCYIHFSLTAQCQPTG